ncbi:MAG: hypothetical protein ABSG77_16860 [Candidatus Acidiferrum sp.]
MLFSLRIVYVFVLLRSILTALATNGSWLNTGCQAKTLVRRHSIVAALFRKTRYGPVRSTALFGLECRASTTFWSGIIGGAFLTTATHGTDQLIVQRLLAAKSEWQSKPAVFSSGTAVLFQFGLFLQISAMLFVFYKLFPPDVPFTRTDTIFPTFIVTRMPRGSSGLLISAILAAAMSNLSAALNSLSSTSIVDFYSGLCPNSSEERHLVVSRILTVARGHCYFCWQLLRAAAARSWRWDYRSRR